MTKCERIIKVEEVKPILPSPRSKFSYSWVRKGNLATLVPGEKVIVFEKYNSSGWVSSLAATFSDVSSLVVRLILDGTVIEGAASILSNMSMTSPSSSGFYLNEFTSNSSASVALTPSFPLPFNRSITVELQNNDLPGGISETQAELDLLIINNEE